MIRTLLALLALASPVLAQDCTTEPFDGTQFTICRVDATQGTLRLFLRDDEGKILGSFNAVDRALKPEGMQLGFAMNAGMYHQDRRPVGLYVENGERAAPLVTREGPGNFGLLPNGVFCIHDTGAQVIEATTFDATDPACRFATQSGPMLVIDGDLHPRFLPDSTSTYVRNGVGTSADGSTAIFAISNRPVTFHHFARLFRDHLKLPNALFFDGNISRLHAPAINRSDFGLPLGPIVGTVVPR